MTQAPQIVAASPDYSVFLAASAGTGKTKVLCDRFINLMLSGADPEKIMCITYTNSAASEMLERIMSLAKLYSDDETQTQEVRGLYRKILFSKYRLKIQTLHSFCLDIITRYKESKGFTSKVLIDQAIKKKALKGIFAGIANNFLELEIADSFIMLTRHCAVSIIESRVLALMSKTSDLKGYLAEHKNLEDHVFSLNKAQIDFDYELAQKLSFDNEILINVSRVDKKAEEILDALASGDYQALCKLVITLDGKPRKLFASKKAIQADERIVEFISTMQQKIMHVEQQHKNHMFAKLNVAFIKVAKEVLQQYEAFKREKNYIDYDDIILSASELLEADAGVLYSLDYEIDHILVDEAQDLSEKQWSLIELISGEFFAGMGVREINRTLFIVGDFKQSIFSFQGAEPEIFKSRYRVFSSLSPDTWKEVVMNRSFRSEQNILKLVNAIFPTLFTDYIEHEPYKINQGHVEVWPLIEPEKNEEQEGWELPSPHLDSHAAHYKLADSICTRITGWLDSGRMIAGHGQIKPQDIMILVRKRSEAVDILAARLRHKGLKVSTPKHGKFTDDLIVMDIISLLEFILNPDDDLNLAGLLKSPFFNISEEDLLDIAYKRPGKLLDEVKHKLPSIWNELMHIRQLFEKLSIFGALHMLLSGTSSFHKRFGEAADESIDNFLEAAHKFEAFGGGIKEFLDYVNFYQIENANQSGESSIRIMTVHSAKGLQSPIVILADAASSETSLPDDVFFHGRELYFSAGAHQKSTTYESVQEAIKHDDYCESLRLLYVAITRAESELYVAGIKSRITKANWYDIISEHATGDMKSLHLYTQMKIPKMELDEAPKRDASRQEAYQYTIKSKDVLEGEIIHGFLEKFSSLKASGMESYLNLQKRKFRSYFTAEDIDKFYKEAQGVVLAFPEVFEQNAISEQGLMAGDKLFRMDRIIIKDGQIDIIDFKTDDNPPSVMPDVRHEYVEQVTNYAKIVKSIFQSHSVRGLLLWTKSRNIIEIIAL